MESGVGEECVVAKVDVGLTGVPETMLLTLHNRVSVAANPNGFFKDPKAVEIYESIDYDYEHSFGKADSRHAIRSMVFDQAILDFWKEHPDGTVVNLAEGLETQRFRLQDEHQNQYKDAMWLTVDSPWVLKRGKNSLPRMNPISTFRPLPSISTVGPRRSLQKRLC